MDSEFLDAARRAVAALDVRGRHLSPSERAEFCDGAAIGEVLGQHDIEAGDGYYLDAFGGSANPEGPAGEVRPLWHRLQSQDEPRLGLLVVHYGFDGDTEVFAELWVPDAG